MEQIIDEGCEMTTNAREFIEEGFGRRKLRLINGKLVEIERSNLMFSENSHQLIREIGTGKLYHKSEVVK